MMKKTDVLIIGAGAAGMAAAVAARRKGLRDILLADRLEKPGGILLQCTHRGFGLAYYKEEMTGQEYAARFREEFEKAGAQTMFSTSVLKISPDKTALLSGNEGLTRVPFDRLVFATGCRERTLYSLNVAGTRPAGIMTCGNAQKWMNIDGVDVGDDIVILGSGDIGQIIARQLVQSGKNVIAMIEKEDRPGGLKKNQIGCLQAYSIPLILHSTITKIHGEKRITGVTVTDRHTGEEKFLACRTLLTAIGLIPEMDLAGNIMTDGKLPSWAFKTGNCDTIHDIVDSVTADGLRLEEVL